MEPALAQFEQEYASQIKIVKMNVDEQSSADFETYGKYMDSRSIPYTVVLKGGKVTAKKVGAMSKVDMEDLIKKP
jgi:thiol-disulfide isomerase/thioredoxin